MNEVISMHPSQDGPKRYIVMIGVMVHVETVTDHWIKGFLISMRPSRMRPLRMRVLDRRGKAIEGENMQYSRPISSD